MPKRQLKRQLEHKNNYEKEKKQKNRTMSVHTSGAGFYPPHCNSSYAPKNQNKNIKEKKNIQ